MAVVESRVEVGDLLRYWRRVRGMSQLDLASEATTTSRHVSFVESGRSQPSRQMVVRLATALDVPLRERNDLLLAAGYAPLYRAGSLDGPELGHVQDVLTTMLAQHEPFPAVVMDRAWTVLQANDGAQRLFTGLSAPHPLPEPANVLELMLEPGPVRAAVLNWEAVARALLDRVRREAVGGVLDASTTERIERIRSRPEVAALVHDAVPSAATAPVVDVVFALDGDELRFFSVVTTLGTPIDVTAQELRLEAFFPTDDTTREAWTARRL